MVGDQSSCEDWKVTRFQIAGLLVTLRNPQKNGTSSNGDGGRCLHQQKYMALRGFKNDLRL
jgi:hypothetical protein